jgi:2-hydroxychromene-2-carboxylate isomerase
MNPNEVTRKPRDKRNGQYAVRDLDRVCKRCGLRLGLHDAEHPFPLGESEDGTECEGFKK